MKSNYDIIGNHIRLIDTRNTDLVTEQVLGINIDKFFMPSVANVIGTDLSKYKLITKGKFACNPMHVGRDERLPVALYTEDTPAIVSPAYFMFEIVDSSVLNEDYLMMWFRRPEFDRLCWLRTDGSVRGGITWDDICRMEIPVPPMDEQMEIVNSYRAVSERIALKKQINDNLEATALALFKEITKENPCDAVLSDYCNFQEGYVNPAQEFPQYFDGEIKWLRGVDFNSQYILNTSRTLTQEGFESAGKSALLFEPNTIVITKSGTIGKLGILGDYMCGNRATINIQPKSSDMLPFVYFFLKSIQSQFYDMAVGSAQVNLYVSVLQQIPCPIFNKSFDTFSAQTTVLLSHIFENSMEVEKLEHLQAVILGELSR